MYYDFHTHSREPVPEVVKMVCVKPGETAPAPYSCGIHPWDTAAPDIDAQLQWLGEHAGELAAVGEIGLDRLRGASLDRQIVILRRQLDLALLHKLPVIAHDVRCSAEILAILKEPARALWHKAPTGANKLCRIIDSGATVSFGGRDLQHLDPALVPLTQLGLETDDSGDDIRETYQAAAKLWQIPLTQLQEQLAANFRRLFG